MTPMLAKLEMTAGAAGFAASYVVRDGESLPAIAEEFRKRGYYLELLTAVDRGEHLTVVYAFNSLEKSDRTALYFDTPADVAVPSITSVYPSAVWLESEVYDLFGLQFSGHPGLRRLLTPPGLEGFPLRKSWNVEEHQ